MKEAVLITTLTLVQNHSVFNSLKEPSHLQSQHTYSLFKFGIEPKWEDPQNSEGGEWRVTFTPSQHNALNNCWINTVLTVIGEGFGPEESDDIAGVVMNRKRGNNRVAIWTRTCHDKDLQMSIGRRWRETSAISADQHYLDFKDLSNVKRPKPRYEIMIT